MRLMPKWKKGTCHALSNTVVCDPLLAMHTRYILGYDIVNTSQVAKCLLDIRDWRSEG